MWKTATPYIAIFFCVSVWESFVPLWGDELFSYAVAKQGSVIDIFDKLSQGMDAHPPLHYWLIFLGIKLIDNPLGARLPFLLIGVLCGFLQHSICKGAGMSNKASVLSAMFLLVTSIQHYSIECRPYVLLVFAQLLSIKYHLNVQMKYIGILAAFVIALYSHYLGAFVIMNSVLFTIMQRKLTVGYVFILLATCIICLPLIQMAFISKAIYVGFSSNWARRSLLKHVGVVYFELLGSIPACLLIMMICYILGKEKRRVKPLRNSEQLFMGIVSATPLVGAVICYIFLHSAFHFRYTIGGVVGIAYYFGVMVDNIPKSQRFVKVIIVLLTTLLIAKPLISPSTNSPQTVIEHFNTLLLENSTSLIVGDHITVMYLNGYFKNHPIQVSYPSEWQTHSNPAFTIMKMFTLYFEHAVTLEFIHKSMPEFIYFGSGFSKKMFPGFVPALEGTISFQPRELPVRDVTIFILKLYRQ